MDLLVEIGCEEIPARFIPETLSALNKGFSERISKHRLDPENRTVVETMATPRRLVLIASSLAMRQEDAEEEILGPKTKSAFDAEGNPTKAALGFASSRGVDVSDLIRLDTPKGEVLALRRNIQGLDAKNVLPGILEDLLASLSFPKTMKWADGSYTFVRPVHWILALLDDQVLPIEFAGIKSSRFTKGHRFSHPGSYEIRNVGDYIKSLQHLDVEVCPEQRQKIILDEACRLAGEVGGVLIRDPKLEEEVIFLVEKPVCVLGRFDESFLELPQEVLIAAMRNHQRYFSIRSRDGKLANAFVAVGNTPVKNIEVVRCGNERVLTARLRDAQFFFEEDLKTPMVDRILGLQEMIFQADLGSYYEKAHRIGNLAVSLAERLGFGIWDQQRQLVDALCVRYDGIDDQKDRFSWNVARASLLAKVDLLTEMVGEFPELQGEIGGVYCARLGDPEGVAQAIAEHYRPRFSKDRIPESHEGALVSLADRLDTLAGCFGVGLRPTGATDPFALRRQCLGVISIILGKGYHISLDWLLKQAVSGVNKKVESALLRKAQIREDRRANREKKIPVKINKVEPFENYLREDLVKFFEGRLRQRFVEEAPVDVVEAVLGAGTDDILDAKLRLEALGAFSKKTAFVDLAVAFKRVANIIKDFEGAQLDPELFDQAEESRLHEVLLIISPAFERYVAERKYLEGMELLANELRNPVDEFFDRVLVNDPEDPVRQANRKALLLKIESMFGRIADFTRLQFHGGAVSNETA